METLEINYRKSDERAVEPFKKFDIDAGFDLTAIWKKETDKYVAYGTGLEFEIPAGYVGLLFPRSSVTNMDMMLKNCVGVIDASYRGEIMFRFIKAHNEIFVDMDGDRPSYENISKQLEIPFEDIPKYVDITMPDTEAQYYNVGDRVGQIVFVPIPMVKLSLVKELTDTDRGSGGYGHTGK